MENLCATFKLFGLPHFVYLILVIAVAVTLIFLFRKYEENLRKYVSLSLVISGGVFVLLEFIGRIIATKDVMHSLPVEPFAIFVYICIFIEVTKRLSWIKFGYFVMLPLSAIGLFVVPEFYTTVNAASLSVISYFLIQMIIIIYSMLQLIWSEEYISKKDIFSCITNYIIIVAIVHLYNVFARFTTLGVHANYFGTMGEDYDVVMGLLYKIIPVPFLHMLPLIAILFGLQFLLIIPFDILKTKKDRKEQMEEIIALGNLKAQQTARKTGKRPKSQVLVRSTEKAKPAVEKTSSSSKTKDGFVSVNKTIQVNNKEKK